MLVAIWLTTKQIVQIMIMRQSRRNIASKYFICFFLIQCNHVKSTNNNYNLNKKSIVKYHEAYPTRTNSPIMWSKKGMITFDVGGSVFSYKIFALSKSCVILQNYPNNHKSLFSSSHPERCTATVHIYTVNMTHDAHAIVRGISKMFQKMVELGMCIYSVKQQNEHSPFMTTRIASSQIFISVTTLHVIFSPSAAVVL